MDIKEEIAARVERLPAAMQEQVLRYVVSLATTTARGESTAALRRFAGSLDHVSAHEMMRAIEEECERVDARDW